MQAHAGALPLPLERTAEPQSQERVDRRDVAECRQREAGREAPARDDLTATVVVATGWLAFYVIASAHHLITSAS
jgi:hypothetical protein